MADAVRHHPTDVADALGDIAERLAVREKEAGGYIVPDYLAAEWQARLRDADATRSSPVPFDFDGAPDDGDGAAAGGDGALRIGHNCRELICEWYYRIVDHFDFNREDVSVAVNYLDRYLATRAVNYRTFSLAATTALYLAIKIFEPGKLCMSWFIRASGGRFTSEHVVTMEDSMLRSLEWRVRPPTPFAFCRDLVGLIPREVSPRACREVTQIARYMIELSVCEYWFATRRPSSVALAGVVCAIDVRGPGGLRPRHKMGFIRRVAEAGMDAGDDEVVKCRDRLMVMYRTWAGGPAPEWPWSSEANLEEEARAAAASPTGIADDREDPRAKPASPNGPTTSRYNGVSRTRAKSTFEAKFSGQRVGSYILEADAALAYDGLVRRSGRKKHYVKINFEVKGDYMRAREAEQKARRREVDLEDTLAYVSRKVDEAMVRIRCHD